MSSNQPHGKQTAGRVDCDGDATKTRHVTERRKAGGACGGRDGGNEEAGGEYVST